MKRLPCYITALLMSGYAAAINAADPVVTLQLGVGKEEIGSSIDDNFTRIGVSVSHSVGITRNSAYHLSADLYTRRYSDQDIQDRDGLLAEVIYSYMPTGGFRRPVYLAGLRLETQGSDFIEQDFDEITLIFGATLRLDDSTSLTAGIEVIDKNLQDRDISILGLFVNTDFRINDRWLWYLNLKLQDEDSDSKGPVAASPLPLALRDAIAMSHGGGPITAGQDLPSSDNTYFTIGINHALSAKHTLDLSYERQEYALSNSSDLEGDTISLDYFYKF